MLREIRVVRRPQATLRMSLNVTNDVIFVRLMGSVASGDVFLRSQREEDDLYEPAVEIIIREGRGSVSLR